MKKLLFLTILFFAIPSATHAAVEFVSIVDTGGASDSDYSSLSTWETGLGTNLTAPSTLVFSGVVTGTAPIDNSSVTLYRSGASTGVGATVVHTAKTGTQILLENVSNPAYGFTTGDEWRIDASNLFTIDATTPDQPQVTAKCRATTGAADTTLVSILGWDTDATHFIKIWTDPSENYRHQGKWDVSKYRLESSNTVLEISEEYTRIDGLQVSLNGRTASYLSGIHNSVDNVNSEIQISNNIVRSQSTAALLATRGISTQYNKSGLTKVWNNIVYNFNQGSSYNHGIYISGQTAYFYNNTAFGCGNGIERDNYGTLIAKNNLSYNNTDNWVGSFDASSTNNLTSGTDPQIPATNKRENVTVTFADEYNNDFHLDSSDTGAKNQGTILYDSGDDSNLNFTTDIDNEARKDSAGTWDIGADENVAKIYRSVGAGATSPLAQGGTADSSYGNMTISGLIATFWRPLPDNVGVGDALQYDADNTGGVDNIAFITKRIDSTHYSIRKSDGTAPTATSSLPNNTWSIYRAYISLSNGIAQTENTGISAGVQNFDASKNLTTNNLQWNFSCFANGTAPDTTAVSISGWTTTADNNIRIYTPTRTDEVGASQRHGGKWDDTKYKLEVTDGTVISIGVSTGNGYIYLDGLQMLSKSPTVDGRSGIYLTGNIDVNNYIYISNNIIRGGNSSSYYQRGISANTTLANFKAWNDIFYDIYPTNGNSGGIVLDQVANAYAYNNTIYGVYWGFYIGSGTEVLKNNIVQSSTAGYLGTFSSASTNNLSDHADAPGSNPQNSKTVSFVDATNKDFHLGVGDTAARNIGADLTNDIAYREMIKLDSGSMAGMTIGGTDIDSYGNIGDTIITRPIGTSWDIGADELITKIYRSVGVGTTAAIISGTSQAISLTISGNTGTFATWPTSADFGVGDVIRYDSDNNGSLDSTAFLTAIDSTAKTATLQNSTGGAPTAMAVGDYDWKLFRAYTSLSAWESGTENTGIGVTYDSGNRDIATNSEQWNVACYANSGTAPDTTGVSISGWTTKPQNYIKVYTPTLSTEVTSSQRHQGKWDDTKYNMTVTNSGDIYISDNYVRVDGLQLKIIASSGVIQAFVINTLTARDNRINISNNIFSSVSTGSTDMDGINSNSANNNIYIWNNILYDFVDISIRTLSNTAYVYNNTITCSNSGYCIGIHTSTSYNTVAKNNIVRGAGDSYAYFTAGAFSTETDYNATDGTDTTGQGPHSKVSQTFSFVDLTNKDFHLLSTDVGAKDFGADLSQDLYLPITSDIDGQGRPKAGVGFASDIGADEGATAIYRSLAPSATGSIASGTSPANSMIIAGTSVTFGTAPGDTIGVGDAIQYDSDNNGTVDSIAFISGRTSGTVYTLQDRTGGTPTSTSATDYDWSIYRAYSSLNNAVGLTSGGTENTSISDAVEHFDIDWSASRGKNLYAYNQQWNIAAYANGTTADAGTSTYSWTTYLSDYLKIYTPYATTEVGTSQRHQGKWDDSKYRIEVSNDSGIANYANFFRIDGIQIKVSSANTSWNRGILNMPRDGSTETHISSCIIKGVLTGTTNNAFGIQVYQSAGKGGVAKVWNNIVYDFINSSYSNIVGILGGGSVSVYEYNNTVFNNYYGISGGSVLKNNISYNNTIDYYGSSSSSSNNLSKDNTSPNSGSTDCGGHSCRNQTVQFADAANKDFHLGVGDTAARNSGADLSADAYLPVTTDIDGHSRLRQGYGEAMDIGADEGATAIYYSVGQSTSTDFKVASNISVSGYTATFETAQTGNIGVGDIVTYTGGSCYITGKTSTSIWNCQNATGGTAPQVSGVSVTSIKRAFASLNSAMGGSTAPQFLNTTDLKTNNYQLNIPCYMDSGTQPDTTKATISGFTTAQPNYIKVYTPSNTATEANQSQRHQGKWTTNAYTISRPNTQGIEISNAHVKVDGIQFDNSGVANQAIAVYNGYSEISNCIIRNTTYGLAYNNGSEYAKAYNNIIYGITSYAISFTNTSVGHFYNNTLVNNAAGFHKACVSTSTLVINNIFSGNTTDYVNGACSTDPIFSYNSTNQASGIPAGTGNRYSQTFTFADSTNYDYHLAQTDAAAKNYGADLSIDSGSGAGMTFNTDIDGNTRNLNSRGWDIGADESATAIYYSVGQSSSDLKTGSPTLSIDSSGNGTLSVAQTGNMGVGDYIEYGTSPYNKAYISGKTSSTVWTVQSATGSMLGVATTEPVSSIKHSYTTLSGAIAGASGATMMNTTDLYTNNYQLNIPCYYDNAADTTATTISGYTTYSMNYIKVYTPNNTSTEANNSQRHSGKWDEGKYRLESAGQTLAVYANYTKTDGLQIKLTSTEGSHSGIYISVEQGRNAYVANNIIKGVGGGYGIMQYSSNLGMGYIYNNIIYNFVWGIYSNNAYVNNNTLVNNSLGGICCNNWQIIVKNNIVQGSQDGYIVSNSSDYNISDIAGDSPGSHSRNGVTVDFVDKNNFDFHLAESDTSARNAGADLSADTNLAVTTDIDGNTRPTQNAFDIGADEGATYIYYSVGQNTSDHKTGSPTITLSGYNATLSVGQTAPNMGVGDLITYTGGSCYITSKTNDDKMHWNCQNATGGTAPQVSGVSVTSIAHAFSSLANAFSGVGWYGVDHLNSVDLLGGNYILNLPCYYDSGADTASINIAAGITGLNNYIKIFTPTNITTETNQTQRHSGKWDDAKYRLEVTDSTGIWIMKNYVRIDGLQITSINPTGNDRYPLRIDNGSVGDKEYYISNNIIKGHNNSSYNQNNIPIYDSQAVVKIWNNILYDIDSSHTNVFLFVKNAYIYNNTINGGSVGIRAYSGTIVAKNNIVQGATDGYNGTFASGSDYNISNVSSDTTGGAHDKANATVTFVSLADNNFHLGIGDTAAKNQGIKLATYSDDPNLNFQTDIDGNARTGNWSIGADDGPFAEAQSDLGTSQAESPNLDINDGLVLYQSFNGDDINIGGTVAYDRSGSGNNGTIVGATPVVGKLGQGMKYSGGDDYIDIADSPSLSPTGAITISSWFKTTMSMASYPRSLVYKDNTYSLFLGQGVANKTIGISIRQNLGTDTFQTTAPVAYNDNAWHQLVGIFDGDFFKIYFDGAYIGSQDTSKTGIDDTSNSLKLGWGTTSYYFDGILDETRIHNRALTAEEIGHLYRTGQDTLNASQAGKNTTGLVGHWTFDGPNVNIGGTVAYDSSGNNNTGTIVGGAAPAIGKLGQAMTFITSKYINAGTASTLEMGTQDMTISTWMKTSYTGTGDIGFFCKGARGATYEGYLFYYRKTDGSLRSYVADGSDLVLSVSNFGLGLNDGKWHHVVSVFNRDGIGEFYADGESEGGYDISSLNGVDITNSSIVAAIGRSLVSNGTYSTQGQLDDFRIYSRALSAEEIGDLYKSGHVVVEK